MASKPLHDYIKILAHSLKQWHNQMRTYYLMLASFDLNTISARFGSNELRDDPGIKVDYRLSCKTRNSMHVYNIIQSE